MIPQDQLSSGQAIINSSSTLTIKQENVVIDGRVQAANIGAGDVVLKGNDSKFFNGVKIGTRADNAVIRDLTIKDFRGSGIIISGRVVLYKQAKL